MESSDTIERARAVLQRAEAELRRLMAEAAAEGEYEILRRLTTMAQALAELADARSVPSTHLTGTRASPGQESTGSQTRGAPLRATASRKSGKKKRGKPSGYPKFKRLGDDLVKIGWSRRDKKEYHHRAPKRVLLLLVDALLSAGGKGQLITSDDFLPLRDAEDNSDVPSYQSYLALGWLVQVDLAHRHGRQGYTLNASESLRGRVEEYWCQLPTR